MNLNNIQKIDPEIYEIIKKEEERQENNIELIASENITSLSVMEAQGSIFTNKYAEGYPKKRYYGGCENVDEGERLAIERVCKLFNCGFANVQPHSGSQANQAVFYAELEPGDKVMGMNLSEGGHLTHGSPVNMSGKLYEIEFYGLDHATGHIDYQALSDKANSFKPKLIIAGASAYPRIIDFKKFREIADQCGALLMVDMAHIAGLVATGQHPHPFPYADYVTSTTHKTLRGPRGGIVLTDNEMRAKKINSIVFPGMQGGPLEHIIAAKAIAFKQALEPSFTDYQKQVLENAQVLVEALLSYGFDLVSGGTENHLMLIDLQNKGLTGKGMQHSLDEAGITLNKNSVPNDPQSPFVTSGVRIGTPAVTTRGMKGEQMKQVAEWINRVADALIEDSKVETTLSQVKQEVKEMVKDFPIYFS